MEQRFSAPQSYTPPHLAEKILTSRSALEGERKLVTVLFCDIANSTPLAERIGAEAMHTVLNRFFELALAEVHRYEGTINQFLGRRHHGPLRGPGRARGPRGASLVRGPPHAGG